MDRERADAWLEGYRQAWGPTPRPCWSCSPSSRGRVVDGHARRRHPADPGRLPFLTFTSDGLVATARDYWFLEPGTHPPHEGWGR